MGSKKTNKKSIRSRIRSNIVRGLVVLFPAYFTFILIQFLIRWLSKPLNPVVRKLLEQFSMTAPSRIIEIIILCVSLIITLLLMAIVGIIAQKVIGRRIVALFERLLDKLPVVRTVYKTFREITRIMTGEATQAYKKTVYIDLPGDTGKVLGFITGNLVLGDGIKYHTVFVPTTPNITSGFLILLRPEQVKTTHMSPEDGLRVVLSAGVLSNNEEFKAISQTFKFKDTSDNTQETD